MPRALNLASWRHSKKIFSKVPEETQKIRFHYFITNSSDSDSDSLQHVLRWAKHVGERLSYDESGPVKRAKSKPVTPVTSHLIICILSTFQAMPQRFALSFCTWFQGTVFLRHRCDLCLIVLWAWHQVGILEEQLYHPLYYKTSLGIETSSKALLLWAHLSVCLL